MQYHAEMLHRLLHRLVGDYGLMQSKIKVRFLLEIVFKTHLRKKESNEA